MSGSSRTLNGWLRTLNNIYRVQNFERDKFQIYSRLVEVAGAFRNAVEENDDYDDAQQWIGKIFAWQCALLECLSITDLESIVWRFFPYTCPLCGTSPC